MTDTDRPAEVTTSANGIHNDESGNGSNSTATHVAKEETMYIDDGIVAQPGDEAVTRGPETSEHDVHVVHAPETVEHNNELANGSPTTSEGGESAGDVSSGPATTAGEKNGSAPAPRNNGGSRREGRGGGFSKALRELQRCEREGVNVFVRFGELAMDGDKLVGLRGRFWGVVQLFLSIDDVPASDSLQSLHDKGPVEVRVKPILRATSIRVSRKLSAEDRKRDAEWAARIRQKDEARAKLAALDRQRQAKAEAISKLPPRDTMMEVTVGERFKRGGDVMYNVIVGKEIDDARLPSYSIPKGFPRENLERGKRLMARLVHADADNLTVTFSLLPPPSKSGSGNGGNASKGHHDGKRGEHKSERKPDNRPAKPAASQRDESFAALPTEGTLMSGLEVKVIKQFPGNRWGAYCPAGAGLDIYLPGENVPEGVTVEAGQKIDAWLVEKDPQKRQATLSLIGPDANPWRQLMRQRREQAAQTAGTNETGNAATEADTAKQGSEPRRKDKRNRHKGRESGERGERDGGGKPRREERRGGNDNRRERDEAPAADAPATHAGNLIMGSSGESGAPVEIQVTGIVEKRNGEKEIATNVGTVRVYKNGKRSGHGSFALLSALRGDLPAPPPAPAAKAPKAKKPEAPEAAPATIGDAHGGPAAAATAAESEHAGADGNVVAEHKPETTSGEDANG